MHLFAVTPTGTKTIGERNLAAGRGLSREVHNKIFRPQNILRIFPLDFKSKVPLPSINIQTKGRLPVRAQPRQLDHVSFDHSDSSACSNACSLLFSYSLKR